MARLRFCENEEELEHLELERLQVNARQMEGLNWNLRQEIRMIEWEENNIPATCLIILNVDKPLTNVLTGPTDAVVEQQDTAKVYRQNMEHSEMAGMTKPFLTGKDKLDINISSGTCSHPSSTRIEVTGRVKEQVTLLNSLEPELVINEEDGPEFGQKNMMRIVSPNILRLKQVFEPRDDQEPMDVVEELATESTDGQLTKVNMMQGELMVVEGSSNVPIARKVQVPRRRGWKNRGNGISVIRIDDLFSQSLVLGGGKKGDKRKVEKDEVEAKKFGLKKVRME